MDTNASTGRYVRDKASEYVVAIDRDAAARHDLTARDIVNRMNAVIGGSALLSYVKLGGEEVQFEVKITDSDERDILAGSRDNQLGAMTRRGEILPGVAQEREVMFVDAKTEMARRAAEVGIDTLFTKEVHLTDDGADFLALVITRAILESVFGR